MPNKPVATNKLSKHSIPGYQGHRRDHYGQDEEKSVGEKDPGAMVCRGDLHEGRLKRLLNCRHHRSPTGSTSLDRLAGLGGK
ncbi:hypothetical protein FQN50_002519 [Emmonsiellopsis sp. PD_5]|nr:hypothetical protein FQN50_002519 [Emmonsiellopsis sp. PD_5]